MPKLICASCMKVHTHTGSKGQPCPSCSETLQTYDFSNSDEFLKREVPRVVQERKEAGIEGLVGGLEALIINTEPGKYKKSIWELVSNTGFDVRESFGDKEFDTTVLGTKGSADLLIRTRKKSKNPFKDFNDHPKSQNLPNTRLETFVFRTRDIEKFVEIQGARGVEFLTKNIVENENYSFIQTIPSTFTGNSIGYIQWHGNEKKYAHSGTEKKDIGLSKPDKNYLKNIRELDHTASRVSARYRDAAIIEFMELTNYHFDFAIYVKSFNSITNVARLTDKDFAMVFTSGISPFTDKQKSGPTEKFIHNYGARVHHMAFRTENIRKTYESLRTDGVDFLLGLVGSPEEGLRQTFSSTSPNTLLVNEYIHRYGDFQGFFTKGNVTKLTEATDRQ